MTERQLRVINKSKDVSVKEFNFGITVNTRIQNVFAVHGIKTLGDVLNITVQDFATYNHFDIESYRSICGMMQSLLNNGESSLLDKLDLDDIE